ncbi:MAG: hypothetical protein ACRDCE_04605 [Cetobacterium sp.]|uniref:hypothetical protein n=1 Tax=Cetobacterium sp. TaxID=2071632 RepID=UPI003EE6BA73
MKKKIALGIALVTTLCFGNTKSWSMNGSEATQRNHDVLMSGRAYIGETAKAEQILTEMNQRHLLKTQPPVKLTYSLERENINKRTLLWNDRNKISYIYLLQRGNIVSFFSIKGKVSSVNSSITNPNMIYNGATLDSPAEDGSYGTNGDAVFFFLTDGTYVEWAGEYLLTDRPLKLSTQPLMSN